MRGKVERDILCPCWWKRGHNDWRSFKHPQEAEPPSLLLRYPLFLLSPYPFRIADSSVMMSLLVQ